MNNEVKNTSIATIETDINTPVKETNMSKRYDEVFNKYNINNVYRIFIIARINNPLFSYADLSDYIKENYKTKYDYGADYLKTVFHNKDVKDAFNEIRLLNYNDEHIINTANIREQLDKEILSIIMDKDTPPEIKAKLWIHLTQSDIKKKTETTTTFIAKEKNFDMWNEDKNKEVTKEAIKTIKQVE